MPPRGLSDLPVELVLSIVEFACEDQPAPRIRDLVLVNRLFSRLALPSLYKDLSDANSEEDPDGFRKLILTLLFEPTSTTFGGFVHSFKITEQEEFGKGALLIEETRTKTENDPQPPEDNQLACERIGLTKARRDELNQLLDVVLSYQEHEETKHEWKSDFLNEPLLVAYLALTLMRLPHLTRLDLVNVSPDVWHVFDYVGTGLLAASKDPNSGISPPFAKLEHVTLGGEAPEYPHSTKPLAIIAKWPSIKSVSATQIGDGDNESEQDPDPWFLDLQPKSTNIHTISFRPECKLLDEHLTRFLGAAKALEDFHYQMGHTWSWLPLSTPLLTQALTPHASSLHTLHLSISVPELDQEDSTFAPMCLASFSALRILRIAFPLLFGFDINNAPATDLTARISAAERHVVGAVPRSIEEFTIMQAEDVETFEVATWAVGAVLRCRGAEEFWALKRMGVMGDVDSKKVNEKAEEEAWRLTAERDIVVWFHHASGEWGDVTWRT